MQDTIRRHPRITLWIGLIAVAGLALALVAVLTRGGDATTATTTVAVTVTRTTTTPAATATTGTATTGTGAVQARSGVTTVVRDVGPFTGVNLAGANVVNVHVGGARSVTVTGERRILPLVKTTVRSGELVISNSGRFTTQAPLHVDVTLPTLSSVALDGSGRLTVDGVNAPHFAVVLGGSGVVRAAGRTDDLRAELKGVGAVELAQLVAANARAVLGGSGRLAVNVTRSLQASLSGTGSIVYGGSPADVKSEVTGSGTITSG